MVRKAFPVPRVINAVVDRVEELGDEFIYGTEWIKCSTMCIFLETAAVVTDNQSGSWYVPLSLRVKANKYLLKSCQSAISVDDEVQEPVADKIKAKLEACNDFVCSALLPWVAS